MRRKPFIRLAGVNPFFHFFVDKSVNVNDKNLAKILLSYLSPNLNHRFDLTGYIAEKLGL